MWVAVCGRLQDGRPGNPGLYPGGRRLLLVPLVGAVLSFLLADWIVRPIVGLTEIADKVTMGDLEASVREKCVTSRDEIGDLARSLERLRSSLRAAMLRLVEK